MKKIIAASVLSLMLFGVGSANSDGMRIGVGTAYADGDAHTLRFDNGVLFMPTPIEHCIEASKKGLLIGEEFDNKFYIYDDKLFLITVYTGSLNPITIECSFGIPKEVLKMP